MRENPDGFPSSPGASRWDPALTRLESSLATGRAGAPIPVYGWDLFED
jgi:hypothetical protein